MVFSVTLMYEVSISGNFEVALVMLDADPLLLRIGPR